MLECFFLFNVDIKTCEMCADSGPLVLMEEERLKLNVEEMVLDPGKETGAGAVQLGVCETSERTDTSLSDETPSP